MAMVVVLGLMVVGVLLWPTRPVAWARESACAAGELAGASEREAPTGPGDEASRGRRDAVTVEAAADALVLCALALRSGLGHVEALEAVAARVPEPVGRELRVVASAHRWGQDAATAWAHVGDGWRSASLAWQAAERSGAAPAGVVLAAAERMRRQESSRVEAAVQRAGVLLVLPLGACFLPGFVGTTVVPVVLHLAGVGLGSTR